MLPATEVQLQRAAGFCLKTVAEGQLPLKMLVHSGGGLLVHAVGGLLAEHVRQHGQAVERPAAQSVYVSPRYFAAVAGFLMEKLSGYHAQQQVCCPKTKVNKMVVDYAAVTIGVNWQFTTNTVSSNSSSSCRKPSIATCTFQLRQLQLPA